MASEGACDRASGLCGAGHRGDSQVFAIRQPKHRLQLGQRILRNTQRDQSLVLMCRKPFKTSKSETCNHKSEEGETKMKRRMQVSIFISVLLTLILTTCAGADEVKLTPSDGAAYEYFGNSVSIAGDYVIAGASGVFGSAYIFKREGASWNEQAKITASDGAADDCFGHSVSISGDYVIVGADWDDDNGSESGSAYIFKRDGTLWNEQAKITASDGTSKNYFGHSVSISGDYVIVSASGVFGSAYIFKREGVSWNEQAKITASDGAAYDGFGGSVSISGDYVIVSASGDDSSGYNSNSGSAYIFKRDGTTWSQQAKITASDRTAGDRFGLVSVSGDHVIVGVQGDNDNGDWSGSAYIFKRNGTSWNEQAKLMASDGAADDRFGGSVSISYDHAIAGAQGDNDNGDWSGSAYIYDIQTTEPPVIGDLNGDDRLTPADAVIALRMAAGSCEPTTAADVSSDGVVNSLDALMILQAVAGPIAL